MNGLLQIFNSNCDLINFMALVALCQGHLRLNRESCLLYVQLQFSRTLCKSSSPCLKVIPFLDWSRAVCRLRSFFFFLTINGQFARSFSLLVIKPCFGLAFLVIFILFPYLISLFFWFFFYLLLWLCFMEFNSPPLTIWKKIK